MTIATKRHASQSQGTQNDINIIYVISFIRYRIQLKVEDGSGMATFILFDLEAKKLLNISVKELLNKCLEVRIWKIKLLFNIY